MRKGYAIISIIFLAICTPTLKGDISAAHKLGEALGKGTKVDINASHLDKSFVPGYAGDTPPESAFAQSPTSNLEEQGTAKLWASEKKTAGEFITHSQKTKQKIEIDPTTDPLFIQANSIIDKPAESLKARIVEEEDMEPTKEYHKCYEAAEPTTHTCIMRRVVTLKPIAEKKHIVAIKSYRHGPYHGGSLCVNVLTGLRYDPLTRRPYDNAYGVSTRDWSVNIHVNGNPFPIEQKARVISSRAISGPFRTDAAHTVCDTRGHWYDAHGSVEVVYKPLPTEAGIEETIHDTCVPLEKLTEEGMCRYGTETIIEGAATKEFDGLKVTRDWWSKGRTYICGYNSKNDCELLRAKGCVQISSRCHIERDGNCLEHEQTYACVKYPTKHRKASSEGKVPFCLTGDCTDQSWNPNEDMAEVLAKLSLLNELQKNITDSFNGDNKAKKINIFPGKSFSCSKHLLHFSDCCGLKSGWGEQLRLTKCDPDEKLLSQQRAVNKCHQVGDEYCAEEGPLGACIRRKTAFCCFESKLARAIQEQARAQLGISWGTPQEPSCGPLSISDFSRVDFKKINFSEVFSDVMSKVKIPDGGKIASQLKSDWMKRLPTPQELKGKKLAEHHRMKEQVTARQEQIKSMPHAGAYSMHGAPNYRKDPEENEPEVVF